MHLLRWLWGPSKLRATTAGADTHPTPDLDEQIGRLRRQQKEFERLHHKHRRRREFAHALAAADDADEVGQLITDLESMKKTAKTAQEVAELRAYIEANLPRIACAYQHVVAKPEAGYLDIVDGRPVPFTNSEMIIGASANRKTTPRSSVVAIDLTSIAG